MTDTSPKQLKADTRQWNSGRVKFAVIGWEGRPDDNYIIFEKKFFGKNHQPDQTFNLKQRDWINLKTLVDGDFQPTTEWKKVVPVVDQAGLSQLITEHPDVFEKLLSNPNILDLSKSSLEALDRIAVKVYEVKAEKIDLILCEISKASGQDLDRFGSLLEDLRLNQVSMMASLVYQQLKVLDLLERTCMDSRKSERDVHNIFDKKPWLVEKSFEIVQSDKPLSQYVDSNSPQDPQTKKRPDLILKTIPHNQDIVLIELKAPGIKLKADHVGQVLGYKALIMHNKPNVKEIHCFVFGYDKDATFFRSKDVEIKTFSELIAELRAEYREYAKVIDDARQVEAVPDQG